MTNRFYDYSIKPFAQPPYTPGKPSTAVSGEIEAGIPPAQLPWEGRAIATHKFRLIEFTAFMEIQRDEIVSAFWYSFFKCISIVKIVSLSFPHSITDIYSYSWAASHPTPIRYLRCVQKIF